MKKSEEKRLFEEYLKRDVRFPWNDWKKNIYHPRHPIGNVFQEHNHKVLVDTLNWLDLDLSNQKILDVGCGYGNWLRYMVELGAKPENCFGIDLSSNRIDVAKRMNPAIKWHQLNSVELPFQDESFDFILQSVVFSSILDARMRFSCAVEMERVTKDGGVILWIDLIQTVSEELVVFSASDVQEYFPRMHIIYQKHMHPKYFRRLNGRYSWFANSIYHFTGFGCESQLFVLRKS